MTKLSVVIVNYNVKYFLEQALLSVRRASKNIDAEILVVDNHSTDGSVAMVREKFPEVKIIANDTNAGFSKANNQAIRKAAGEYILLLNPDTIVEEDTFEKCISFMDAHPEAGGLGVKMLDGKGNFLPESKRGFPTPMVAFYKAFGFTALFPRSNSFARYYLGHLGKDETNEVEVLAGAFMFLRKKVLDEIGLLDEEFFMYGEDIDLSYRIVQAGYKNYYFPDTRIIHYKGESTKKGSLNYVRIFYQAMIIFARKHFSSSQANFYIFFIKVAVWVRAIFSLLVNMAKALALPVVDAAVIFGGLYFIEEYWAANVKETAAYYPEIYILVVLPLYVLVWIFTIFFSGGYDKPYRYSKTLRGIVIGTVIILAIYGLLDEAYRFSRAIIVLGAAWGAVATISVRLLINFYKYKSFNIDTPEVKKVVIVGSRVEADRALTLMKQTGVESNFIGIVVPEEVAARDGRFLGDISELDDIVDVYDIDEIIFCSKDLAAQDIISWMTKLGNEPDYKIIPEESFSIIGSNSKNTAGDLYAVDVNLSINKPMKRRNKRVLDLLICAGLLITLPINIFIIKKPAGMLRNWFQVLFGQKSWVGYNNNPTENIQFLPKIREGVLSPKDGIRVKQLNEMTIDRLNLLYAKDYSTEKDLNIVLKGFRELGR